jgi:hypothetical protein
MPPALLAGKEAGPMSRQPQRLADLLPAVIAQLASQAVQEAREGRIRDTETSNAGEAVSDAYRGSNQQLTEAGVPA